MADVSVGDAVGAGFQLVSRRPGAVMIWGAIIVAVLVLRFALLWPMFSMMFDQMAEAAKGGTPKPPDMTGMLGLQALSYLTSFIQGFVMTVVYCAAFRAIIHPDQRSFASLRLGATELLLFLLMIGLFIAFFIAAMILVIPVAIVLGVLGAMHAVPVAIMLGVILGFALAGAMIYGALRLAMVGPMMVEDGKVHVTDAWALTKGKVGSLFAIALIMMVITLVAEVVLFAVIGGIGFGVLSSMAGGMQALPAFFKQPVPVLLSSLTPLIAGFALLLIPIYGVVTAIWSAPWARAYLDLRHSPADAFK